MIEANITIKGETIEQFNAAWGKVFPLCPPVIQQATHFIFRKKGSCMDITSLTMTVGDPPVTVTVTPTDANGVPRDVDGDISYAVTGSGFDIIPGPSPSLSFDVVALAPGSGSVEASGDADLTSGVKQIATPLPITINPAPIPEADHFVFSTGSATLTARSAKVRPRR